MAETQGFLERFRDVVARYPEQIAVVTNGNQVVSYRELLKLSEQFGSGLLQAKAQPEQRIGLGMPRSADFIAAMIGCWHAATAFVPIDTRWPRERLEYIIRDSGIQLAIANEPMATELTKLGVTLANQSSAENHVDEPATFLPDRLAYAIYTSGSTGSPKGVLVEHRGIVNLIDSQIDAFRINKGSRSLWILSPAFDASISDLGTALLSAATVYIESEDVIRDPVQLIDVLTQHSITHIDLPPALLRILNLEAIPQSLQTVVIGGEPASVEAVRQWANKVRLVNVYGPTEATVCTSLGVCDPITWQDHLIGQPISATRYEVLDERLNPVPIGGTGELYLTGVGLARGYLNRPDLTANKFPTIRNERWYRTSDRICHRRDGEYIFLGRTDRQFKLLGQLVEPAEIEARLLEMKEIREAAVVRRVVGNRDLIIAVVVLSDQSLLIDQIRQHLVNRIPPWMIPHHFEFISALPRTTADKVDYVALEKSDRSNLSEVLVEIDDSCSVAEILLSIWSSVLGRHADSQMGFFDQGGDSLGVFQIVVAAQSRGIKIQPVLIAEGLTVSQIASRLQAEIAHDAMPASELEAVARSRLSKIKPPLPGRNVVANNPGRLLLTGATGFLGKRLLSELLARTTAHIDCLVRGVRRLQAHPRVHEISCDLELPRFGLNQHVWQELSNGVDSVYHCAAAVDMIRPYHQLRAANLDALAQILELTGSGRPKILHYASTLSVFIASDSRQSQFEETDDLSMINEVYGGYAQSKWTAERLLRLAKGRFGPVVQYRFGFISGDSNSGQGPGQDLLSHFIRGLVQVGGYPPGLGDLAVDTTPVDYAAAAMAHLSLVNHPEGMTFHIVNPRSLRLSELLDAMKTTGVKLEPLPMIEFANRASRLGPLSAATCLALCRSHTGYVDNELKHVDLFQSTNRRVDQTHTISCLTGSGLACPLPDPPFVQRLVAAAIRGVDS